MPAELVDTLYRGLADISAGALREGLPALAVGTGLQVMAALMEDVTAAARPKGRHDPERTTIRHGHGRGSVAVRGAWTFTPTPSTAAR